MIKAFKEKRPILKKGCYIDDTACLIGDIEIGNQVSIYPYCVIRGDHGQIKIGNNTNIQDLCIIHEETTIKDNVSIGHRVIIHGATIEDNCLIGMGSTILDKAVIGKNCLIGANSLITKNMVIPNNSLVLGSPAKIIRTLSTDELTAIKENCELYLELLDEYKKIL